MIASTALAYKTLKWPSFFSFVFFITVHQKNPWEGSPCSSIIDEGPPKTKGEKNKSDVGFAPIVESPHSPPHL